MEYSRGRKHQNPFINFFEKNGFDERGYDVKWHLVMEMKRNKGT